MDNLIAANYAGGLKLHAVLCSNDSTALGVTNSLIGAGFTKEEFPLITGQDCDIANTKNIIAGYQAMSVFKDTRTLAEQVVKMVQAIVNGEEPEVNDTETYFNGVFVVPTYLCEPVFADINNYEELLIESGYYTREQLGLQAFSFRNHDGEWVLHPFARLGFRRVTIGQEITGDALNHQGVCWC